MKIMYCISCGKQTPVTFFEGDNLYFHSKVVDGEVDLCDGPFTTCPPPEPDEDWELVATPPDDDEQDVMDAGAEELLMELQ